MGTQPPPWAAFLSEEIFPNIQSKLPLTLLEAIASESKKVPPQPPLLQTKYPQFPQSVLLRLVLQTPHQPRCSSLDTLQHFNVLFVVRGPEKNTRFEVQPHPCQVQGHDQLPTPASHTIPDTSQNAVGLLGHLCTLLIHVQPAVNKHSKVLFRWAAFQPLLPKPVVLHGVVVTQMQDLAFGRVETDTVGLDPLIESVQIPL